MYHEDYFYHLIDILNFDLIPLVYPQQIVSPCQIIIKIFNKGQEYIVVETINGQDNIIEDNRISKTPLEDYDLIYLKVMERYTSSVELPNMVYEKIQDLGCWCRVKIEDYNPKDKLLKPFYLKKPIAKQDLAKYAKNPKELEKLEKFFDVVKEGKFTKPKIIQDLFNKKCYNKTEV